MREMVNASKAVLAGTADLRSFGTLLHEAWEVKRGLTRTISSPEIDEIYEAAQRAGAIGGKLLGAGGGGFMLFFVRPEDQASVRKALQRLLCVPFRFESTGSQIIFYEPDGLDGAPERPKAQQRRWIPAAVSA